MPDPDSAGNSRRSIFTIDNLKGNWYVPFCAGAFFYINAPDFYETRIGIVVAILVLLLISCCVRPVTGTIRNTPIPVTVFSLISSLGVFAGDNNGVTGMINKYVFTADSPLGGLPSTLFYLILLLSVYAAMVFLFICFTLFWNKLVTVFKEVNLIRDLSAPERVVYSLIIILSIALTCYAFLRSNAFYYGNTTEDVLFTSDSRYIAGGNAYQYLWHSENDIRQPLFAAFAAPFVSFVHVPAALFGLPLSVTQILVDSVQIVMMIIADLLLAKMMGLSGIRRICFVVLLFCTHTHLMFMLVMEQYIVAYFWLILCLYLASGKHKERLFALTGAGGTLLTGMAVLPFVSGNSPVREFRSWFRDVVSQGLIFLLAMLAMCRFDVLVNLVSGLAGLAGFAGNNITWTDKLYQYTHFIADHFTAPDITVSGTSYLQSPSVSVSIAGIIIFAAALAGGIICRKDKAARTALCWLGYSAAVLLIMGWGTAENGLILYELYFGWPLAVLLYMFADRIFTKLKCGVLLPITAAILSGTLLFINIPAIFMMISFAADNYPA